MNKNSSVYSIIFMIMISAVFGTGVALVHYTTRETLEKNETMHQNRTIAHAFMLNVTENNPQAYEQAIKKNLTVDTINAATDTFFLYTDIKTTNIGFIFAGTGFWDVIRGIVILSPDLEEIKNIQFLEQKETPGLGARIEEPEFIRQFQGLDIAWNASVDSRIIIGSAGADSDAGNRVDAITGASQTSMALMKILNKELEAFRKVYKNKNHG